VKNKLKAILFDLGSTLLEYENFEWEEIARKGMKAGHQFLIEIFPNVPPIEICAGIFHQSYTMLSAERQEDLKEVNFEEIVFESFRKMNLPAEPELMRNFIYAFYQPISEDVAEVDGSSKALKELKSLGLKLVIVSNSIFPAYLHLMELRRFGILPHIDGMVFSCELGVRKPHPDIYICALEIAGCSPDEAIFVGDRFEEDIKGPEDIGLTGILRKKPGREYPEEMSNYASCDLIKELKNMLGLIVDNGKLIT